MRQIVMFRTVAAALVLGAGALSGPAVAGEAAIGCGSFYTVARGDTLFKIATRAYGDGWQYKAVHAANSDLLPTAESIEIGDQILIPCLDGSGPATRAEALAAAVLQAPADTQDEFQSAAQAIAQAGFQSDAQAEANSQATAETVAEAPMQMIDEEDIRITAILLQRAAATVGSALLPGAALAAVLPEQPVDDDAIMPLLQTEQVSDLQIRLVTGAGLAPFAGLGSRESGMATAIIERSAEIVVPGQSVSVAAVNDWAAHLDVLLPGGAFDLSFPWLKPDCDRAAALGPVVQRLCDDFAFSRPLFEASVAIYVRAGDPVTDMSRSDALVGKRLCQPEGYAGLDLGVGGPEAVRVAVPAAADCLAQLIAGEFDAAMLLRDDAEIAIRKLDLAGTVAEAEGLRTTRTLHAVALKGSLNGEAALAQIDLGIDRLMLSGGWFEVVAAHRSRMLAVQ